MWSCQQNMIAADLEDFLREHLLIPHVWLQVLEDSISETLWLLFFMLNLVFDYSLHCFRSPHWGFVCLWTYSSWLECTLQAQSDKEQVGQSITTLTLDTVSLNVASYHISPFGRCSTPTHHQLPSFIVSHTGHLKTQSTLSWTDAVCLWPCWIPPW